MNDRLYPVNRDCVWLGSDRDGHVGAFVTGGRGPIPIVLLDLGIPRVEDHERMVWDLPKTSEVRLLVSVKRPDSFIQMAERGIFVYDWRDVERRRFEYSQAYEPVAVPVSPLTMEKLQGKLGEVSAIVKFDEVCFSDGTMLKVPAQIPCRQFRC